VFRWAFFARGANPKGDHTLRLRFARDVRQELARPGKQTVDLFLPASGEFQNPQRALDTAVTSNSPSRRFGRSAQPR